MRATVGALVVAASVLLSCGSSRTTPAFGPSASSQGGPLRPYTLPAPADFREACRLEGFVCSAGDFETFYPFPAALKRPLVLPLLSPGGSCPVSAAHPISTPAFGGVALGTGPARPLAAAPMNAAHAILLDRVQEQGWYAFKTLWFTEPSYQGPVRIRGARIDAPGAIAFGESPTLAELIVPPDGTVNGRDGWREAPGGTFVKTPGCYAWQVDGVGFSNIIVFSAVVS